MDFGLIPFSLGLSREQTVNEVVRCNDLTQHFGLMLDQTQAVALVETRALALSQNGRVEFGRGVTDKLILEFCDSPYLSMQNYAQTLHELIEVFYHYKNETLDLIGDDELIRYMKQAFDGVCQGSVDLLSGRELYRLARNLHLGRPANYVEDSEEEEEEDG